MAWRALAANSDRSIDAHSLHFVLQYFHVQYIMIRLFLFLTESGYGVVPAPTMMQKLLKLASANDNTVILLRALAIKAFPK